VDGGGGTVISAVDLVITMYIDLGRCRVCYSMYNNMYRGGQKTFPSLTGNIVPTWGISFGRLCKYYTKVSKGSRNRNRKNKEKP